VIRPNGRHVAGVSVLHPDPPRPIGSVHAFGAALLGGRGRVHHCLHQYPQQLPTAAAYLFLDLTQASGSRRRSPTQTHPDLQQHPHDRAQPLDQGIDHQFLPGRQRRDLDQIRPRHRGRQHVHQQRARVV
jgi:hypothetical protein